ncbi:MAG: dockerin type I repeat-containing protein, partial [Gammaproteobacteria bacterium]|nr:dockerin type I repeat-containing protein [Gammaproteobacteria bacterium]
WINNSGEIVKHELSTGEQTVISKGELTASSVRYDYRGAIYNARYRDTYGPYNIYFFDKKTNTHTQLTDNSLKKSIPVLEYNTAVWFEGETLIKYDLTTQTKSEVVSIPGVNGNPSFNGGKVVYSVNGSIHQYNLNTGEQFVVQNEKPGQYSPAIYADRIVWADYSEADVVNLATLNTKPRFGSVLNNRTVTVDEEVNFYVSAIDVDHPTLFINNYFMPTTYVGHPWFLGKSFYTTLLGDLNQDGSVTDADLEKFKTHFLAKKGDENYSWEADFTNDGYINMWDLAYLRINYQCQPTACRRVGIFRWTPKEEHIGSYINYFTVSDGLETVDKETWLHVTSAQ